MSTLTAILELLYASSYHLLVLLAGVVIWQQWASYRRLSQFKGPFWACLTNLWMANSVVNRKQHLDLFDVSRKYGELARIGPNILLTSDPELVTRMSSARSGYTRADWYAGQKLEVDHDNLISTVDDKLHTKRRAQMAIGYSGKEITGLEPTIDKHVQEFINLIKRSYITSPSYFKPMDIARKIAFYTMDVTCDLAFGQPWGCLSQDKDVDQWFESNDIVLPNAMLFSTIPLLTKIFSIPFFGRMIMPSENDATGAGRLVHIVKEIVRKRFSTDAYDQRRDMMGSFIRHGITRTEAVSEATLQIVAGTDTTGTVIRTTLLHIFTNPQIYGMIQAEIGNFSHRAESSVISGGDANNFPYLQAIIKEGARICPPATGLLSKKTPPQGDTINGMFVPGGVDIGQCAWGLQRSKVVYGEDSMLFRPERWLEAEGVKLERMEKSLGLVWGYGKFSCLGKNIAWLQMSKVIFELLKHFDFTIIDPTRPWKSENVGLWMQSEMFVKVTERSDGR